MGPQTRLKIKLTRVFTFESALLLFSQGGNSLEANNNNAILPRAEPVRQGAPPKFNVQPPASEDFSSGDESGVDEEDRPLTRGELAARSLKILSKKERTRSGARSQAQRKA